MKRPNALLTPLAPHVTTKKLSARLPIVALALICALSAAQAQDKPAAPDAAASAPAAAPATSEAAREALSKKEGDADQSKVLKETLSATDKQYSLLPAGKRAITYDLTYSYIGQQQIVANFTGQTLTAFSIENSRGHTITNTFSADYGLKDNFTANVTVPFVTKYSLSENFSGLTNAFGDISIGARVQPFPVTREFPALTATATLRLPTGRSPYKTVAGEGLGTGAGYAGATLGVNASKIVDPVAIFGSVNMSFGLPAKHLSQVSTSGQTLNEVRPGMGAGFGIGFAYAMSYNITTTMSFSESVQAGSRLRLTDTNGAALDTKTAPQTSAMVNLGLGVRVSPVTTMNFTVGIGLTTETPNFTVGMNMPLHL